MLRQYVHSLSPFYSAALNPDNELWMPLYLSEIFPAEANF